MTSEQASQTDIDLQRQRELQRDRELRRERNALTIMPVPVKIPVDWYVLLPRVLPLVTRAPEDSKYCLPGATAEAFQRMWKQRFMRRDGDYVWVHLGGIECYETIPNFAKNVAERIKARDIETKEKSGLKGLLDHWRLSIADLNNMDDKVVLETRMKILRTLEPLMSTLALSGAWGAAYERSRENILKIRPTVQKWIEQHGKKWDLNEPFGGKLAQK